MTDVFISYSGKSGRKIADRIEKGLRQGMQKELPGIKLDVFVDHKSIPLGDDWTKTIWHNLCLCKWFVFVATHAALESLHAQQELGGAIMGALIQKRKKKRVIPLLGDDMEPDSLGFAKRLQGPLKDIHKSVESRIARVVATIIQEKKAMVEQESKAKKTQKAEDIFISLIPADADEKMRDTIEQIMRDIPRED